MIELLVFIVILAIIYYFVSLLPLPAPFDTIVKVLFVIIAVIAVLNGLGFTHFGLVSFPRLE